MPYADDRDVAPPIFVGLRPRHRFSVTGADGVRHSLDPERDRVSVDHPWVRQRPELWEPDAERVSGQGRKSYEQALSRTRSRLASMCGRARAELERGGSTRTADPSTRTAGSSRPSQRPLRLP